MKPKEAVRYTPPKDGTRPSWHEPTSAEAESNFTTFPVMGHDTEWGEEPETHVDEVPERVKAVPVEITNPTLPTRSVSGFVANSIVVAPGTRAQIASRRSNRTVLKLLNMTAGKTVWIGNDPDVSDARDSYPLLPAVGPGDTLDMRHQREVFAYNPDNATPVVVVFYAEYTLDIQ